MFRIFVITTAAYALASPLLSPADSAYNYASTAELTNLAHTSAIHAKTATENQEIAGNRAAFGIQNTFAQAAKNNAATAQAALIGKKILIQDLHQQVQTVQHQLQAEVAQDNAAQQAANAAQQFSTQAQHQVNALSAALAAAQTTAVHASQAAADAASATATQRAMVVDAKTKVAQLSAQLDGAVADLHETEEAARKAAAAAKEARDNVGKHH